MKLFKVALFSLAILFSCKKDSDMENISDERSASLEERVLDVNKVATATKIGIGDEDSNSDVKSVKVISASEIPPTTDEVQIILPKETQTAFQQSGLEFKIGGSQDFDGVYIRVKDDNGNLSEDVLKVEFDNYEPVFSRANQLKTFKNSRNQANNDLFTPKTKVLQSLSTDVAAERTIDIDFEGLEPGRFCYSICVYVENADGNGGEFVSQPGDVCVEVEAWGGNSALVRNWKFIRQEFYELEKICTKVTGEDYICNDREEEGFWENNVEYEEESSYCGKEGTYLQKSLNNFSEFDIRANGTISLKLSGYDYETYNDEDGTCFDTPKRDDFTQEGLGNWAYNEERNELTIVLFRIRSNSSLEGEFDEEVPEGFLFIDAGKVTFEGNSLKIFQKDVDEYNNSENSKEVYTDEVTFILNR
ncbi:hypothetical protein ACXGQW_04345 [Wenyingzhuangia sp. IMCC45533]